MNFRSPFIMILHIKFALTGQAVSGEKIFENVDDVAGRTPEHDHPKDVYTVYISETVCYCKLIW